MNVKELIAHLSTLPPAMPVAYCIYSEQCLLEVVDIKIERHCLPRADGWVHDARPDKETQDYVILG